MNDLPAIPWRESDWDRGAIKRAQRYAETQYLDWPPRPGDFDRYYERVVADRRVSA